jgi:Subtilase family
MKLQHPHRTWPRASKSITTLALLTFAATSSVWAQTTGVVITPATGTPSSGGSNTGRTVLGVGLLIGIGALLFNNAKAAPPDERYQSPETTPLPQFQPRQLVVSWLTAQQSTADTLLQASGSTQQNSVDLPNLGMRIAVLTFANDALAATALLALQANPNIIADRMAIAYPMQTADAVPGKQYAHDLLKAPSKGGTKLANAVTIGIIDTEVTNAASLSLANFKAKRIFADTDKPAVPDHGNAVAAIMAATGNGFEGLAQGTSLRAAGVMREVAPGVNATNTLLVAQALDWMVGEKVQVVNLSLGSASDAVLAAVVSKTQSTGMVLVAAAGNGGPSAAPSYPAAYPGVIAVTAIDAQKRLYTRANRGPYIAIAAPGVDVWVPVAAGAAGNGSKGKYVSGTSFASPFVAAAVAQSVAAQAAAQPAATPQALIQKLCSKAANLGTATAEFGCGLLQM